MSTPHEVRRSQTTEHKASNSDLAQGLSPTRWKVQPPDARDVCRPMETDCAWGLGEPFLRFLRPRICGHGGKEGLPSLINPRAATLTLDKDSSGNEQLDAFPSRLSDCPPLNPLLKPNALCSHTVWNSFRTGHLSYFHSLKDPYSYYPDSNSIDSELTSPPEIIHTSSHGSDGEGYRDRIKKKERNKPRHMPGTW